MGIEPNRTALKSLQNMAFRDLEKPACDWRANLRVLMGNVGLETTPPFAIESPLSDPKRTFVTGSLQAGRCSRPISRAVKLVVAPASL